MARQIDNDAALAILAEQFPLAEADFSAGADHGGIEQALIDTVEVMFQVKTQAYREAMVGCAVARIYDKDIDIRLPATESGEDAFSGRALSDRVIAPFMREQAIPISGGPYLSALRGGARFIPGGEPRIQRDQIGFDALVEVVDYVRVLDKKETKKFLRFLLRRFIELREESNIGLRKIAKPNIDHLGKVVEGLLKVRSGGRLPSMLAVAMYQTLSECFDLGWDVDFQGINVADAVSGAVGDITIKDGDDIVLGIEVTERPVPASRVVGIFEQKISPNSLDDYLILTSARPTKEAFDAARKYTAVGHEINFVHLPSWIRHNLITVGAKGRVVFQGRMISLLSAPGTLADIKVAWNNVMDAAIAAAAADAFEDEV